MKETNSVKLDKTAKDEARLIFKQLSLTMGEAFNLFLYQVSLNKGLPFEVKIPNKVTQNAIEEARNGKHIGDFSTSELVNSGISLCTPCSVRKATKSSWLNKAGRGPT